MTIERGKCVFYKTGSAMVRARVKTIHRDGSITVVALFYWDDNRAVGIPGYLGFEYRLSVLDII